MILQTKLHQASLQGVMPISLIPGLHGSHPELYLAHNRNTRWDGGGLFPASLSKQGLTKLCSI